MRNNAKQWEQSHENTVASHRGLDSQLWVLDAELSLHFCHHLSSSLTHRFHGQGGEPVRNHAADDQEGLTGRRRGPVSRCPSAWSLRLPRKWLVPRCSHLFSPEFQGGPRRIWMKFMEWTLDPTCPSYIYTIIFNTSYKLTFFASRLPLAKKHGGAPRRHRTRPRRPRPGCSKTHVVNWCVSFMNIMWISCEYPE